MKKVLLKTNDPNWKRRALTSVFGDKFDALKPQAAAALVRDITRRASGIDVDSYYCAARKLPALLQHRNVTLREYASYCVFVDKIQRRT